MTFTAIFDSNRRRLVSSGDIAVGLCPPEVSTAVMAFPNSDSANKALPVLARLLGRDPRHLVVKKLKTGMTDSRITKHNLELATKKHRNYCGRCGERIKRRHLKKLPYGKPLEAQALVHGEFVAVLVCSSRCQRQLHAANERKLECLDQETVALRNGQAVLKSLKAFVRRKAQEASRSQNRECEPATSSPS